MLCAVTSPTYTPCILLFFVVLIQSFVNSFQPILNSFSYTVCFFLSPFPVLSTSSLYLLIHAGQPSCHWKNNHEKIKRYCVDRVMRWLKKVCQMCQRGEKTCPVISWGLISLSFVLSYTVNILYIVIFYWWWSPLCCQSITGQSPSFWPVIVEPLFSQSM